MANMTANDVSFKGDAAKIELVHAMFEELAATQGQSGVLPEFLMHKIDDHDYGCCFDISVESCVRFETKWREFPQVMIDVAKHFGVGFELYYDGSESYGIYIYKEGEETGKDYGLGETDFNKLVPDGQGYSYNGEWYECRDDAYEDMLYEKYPELKEE